MNYRQYYRLPAGASSHISKEMIALSFVECFQIMMFLLFFRNHFLCFLLHFLFFFFKVQSKIGVRIIHGSALYTGKYGENDTKSNNPPCLMVIIDFEKAFDSLSRCFLFFRPWKRFNFDSHMLFYKCIPTIYYYGFILSTISLNRSGNEM